MRTITKELIKRLDEGGMQSRYDGIGEDGSDLLVIQNDKSEYPVLVGISDASAHMLLCVKVTDGAKMEELLKDINEMNMQCAYVKYVLDGRNIMAQSSVLYNNATMQESCMLILDNLLTSADLCRFA